MKLNVKKMFISLSLLALFSGCAALPAQKVALSKESVQDLRLIMAPKSKASRSARFLQCVKDLQFDGLKPELLIPVCEAAMETIR